MRRAGTQAAAGSCWELFGALPILPGAGDSYFCLLAGRTWGGEVLPLNGRGLEGLGAVEMEPQLGSNAVGS